MADDKPIIIIKKKGGHGGHHGGAWKVAYADFVTAMMAFFMVMWLVNTAEETTKQNIASYFRRPGLFHSGSGTPLLIGEAGILRDAYVPPHKSDTKKQGGKDQDTALPKNTGTDEQKDSKRKVTIKGEQGKSGGQKDAEGKQGLLKDSAPAQGELSEKKPPAGGIEELAQNEKQMLGQIADEIKKQIAGSKELQDLLGMVDVKIDADGLNIEIMDTEKVSMFASGSARINPEARDAFAKLASIIKNLPNEIDIVGHTDSKPFSSRPGAYSNWELSADRAQAARRLLEEEGVVADRIRSVVGRSDKEPRIEADPLAAANRRITLKMRFKFNQNVDLGKQPEALNDPDKIPEPQPKVAEQPAIARGQEQSPPSTTQPATATDKSEEASSQAGSDTVHSFEAKDLKPKELPANDHYRPKKNVSARERDDRIKLSDEPGSEGQNGSTPGKGGIFGDNPIISPNDIMSSF
ncbi:MAG: OmpA family protein [Oligoflexia bacterium]|nr:OmpA family protein [Oligoflexia bacterium]